MKNKIEFRKYLKITVIVSICILSLFLVIRVYEYKTYTNNFNNKLDMIISKIKEEYPNITDTDIMNIINSNESSSNGILEQYGIDLKNRLIMINKTVYSKLKDEKGRWFLHAKMEAMQELMLLNIHLELSTMNYK